MMYERLDGLSVLSIESDKADEINLYSVKPKATCHVTILSIESDKADEINLYSVKPKATCHVTR